MKYSIIIPTYNKLDECLAPCLESLIKHTPGIGVDVEVIVVANGCSDGTVDYVQNVLPSRFSADITRTELRKGLKLLSYPDPLGYTKAVNTGLGVAVGEYVVLLNNDCQVLDFAEPGEWLDMLSDPFEDPSVGITGPSMLFSEEAGMHFTVFFCAMIPRRLFFEIGYLDETFNPGGGEDIDFCLRLEKAGYRQVRVPYDGRDWSYQTEFPIYHAGEKTVHDPALVPDWETKFKKRMELIRVRTARSYYSNFADVTCYISTKGRYFTTLPMAMMSVAMQELKPKRFILFQDDPDVCDLRSHDVYKHVLSMFDRAGIRWEVIFGNGTGQVRNHQLALDMSDTEWVWRLDDDNFAEPDVLRKLMEETASNVAAVAPSCVDPSALMTGSWSTKINDINTHANVQWLGDGYPNVVPAEHLYSTFIYRRSMTGDGYDVDKLSPAGHREETIFTHRMKRAGHTLLVNRSAMVWHLREGTGGIRSHRNLEFWNSDERHFRKLCDEWGVKLRDVLNVNLEGGLGDHYMFRMALDDIRKKHPNSMLKIYCAHPECLEDEKDVHLYSVADGYASVPNFADLSVYRWCMARNWTGSMVDAFKEIYK